MNARGSRKRSISRRARAWSRRSPISRLSARASDQGRERTSCVDRCRTVRHISIYLTARANPGRRAAPPRRRAADDAAHPYHPPRLPTGDAGRPGVSRQRTHPQGQSGHRRCHDDAGAAAAARDAGFGSAAVAPIRSRRFDASRRSSDLLCLLAGRRRVGLVPRAGETGAWWKRHVHDVPVRPSPIVIGSRSCCACDRAGLEPAPDIVCPQGRRAEESPHVALCGRACEPVLSLQAMDRGRLARACAWPRRARACGRRDRRPRSRRAGLSG